MIEIFPWNEEFRVGIEEIDKQHRRLVEIINELANISLEIDKRKFNAILKELGEYTIYHFSSEEKIWDRYLSKTPQDITHKKKHREFEKAIENIAKNAQKSLTEQTILELLQFLVDWLANHILYTDRRMAYATILVQKGMAPQEALKSSKQNALKEKERLVKIILDLLQRHVKTSLKLIGEFRKEKHLQQKLRLYEKIFYTTPEGALIVNEEFVIEDVNYAFLDMFGKKREEIVGEDVMRFFQKCIKDVNNQMFIIEEIAQKQTIEQEIWLETEKKVVPLYLMGFTLLSIENKKYYVFFFKDISLLKQQEKKLEFIAYHDPLTGLPNRILAIDRLKQSMARAKRRKEWMALAYIDLDGFKKINDVYGHDVGDKFLQKVAKNLEGAVREEDTIARIGGDEFIAIINDISNIEYLNMSVFERLLKAASKPVKIGDKIFSVTASIGVSIYPKKENTNKDADFLIREADIAMYHAKRSGKNKIVFFEGIEERAITKREYDIAKAIKQGELALLYQPVVDLETGKMVLAEALLRWNHPKHGEMPPFAFLPQLAKEDRVKLQEWIIKTALKQFQEAKDDLHIDQISINLDGDLFLDTQNVEVLDKELRKRSNALRYLVFDVHEKVLAEKIDAVVDFCSLCKDLHIQLSIDDFSGENISIAGFKQIACDYLKVSRAIILNALENEKEFAVAEGIKSLSEAFFCQPVAVGVENKELGILVKKLGYRLAQGFAIAAPMSMQRLKKWKFELPKEWQEVHEVSKEIAFVLYAKIEHMAWVKKIHNAIYQKNLSMPELDEEECAFAKSLQKLKHFIENKNDKSLKKELATITKLHHELHDIAKSIGNLQSLATASNIMPLYRRLEKVSAKLVHHLAILEKKMEESSK